MADRHPGVGQIAQLLGVVLVPEHVRRLATLQRHADPIGASELFGVAETRRQLDAVEVPLQMVVGCQPGQHHARPVSEDDADRLARQTLAQVLQHRQGAAGQRGVAVGIADVGKVHAAGRDMPLPAAPPRRQDRVTHQARLDGPRCQKTLPGQGQPGVIALLRPQARSARQASPSAGQAYRVTALAVAGRW